MVENGLHLVTQECGRGVGAAARQPAGQHGRLCSAPKGAGLCAACGPPPGRRDPAPAAHCVPPLWHACRPVVSQGGLAAAQGAGGRRAAAAAHIQLQGAIMRAPPCVRMRARVAKAGARAAGSALGGGCLRLPPADVAGVGTRVKADVPKVMHPAAPPRRAAHDSLLSPAPRTRRQAPDEVPEGTAWGVDPQWLVPERIIARWGIWLLGQGAGRTHGAEHALAAGPAHAAQCFCGMAHACAGSPAAAAARARRSPATRATGRLHTGHAPTLTPAPARASAPGPSACAVQPHGARQAAAAGQVEGPGVCGRHLGGGGGGRG